MSLSICTRLEFRSCLEFKISSLRSIAKLVRAPFLNHCALNNDERANHSRFPFTNVISRVRGCLTLTIVASLLGRAASLVYGGHSRGPFAARAHALCVAGWRKFSAPCNHSGWRMIQARARQGKVIGLLTRRCRGSRRRTVAVLPDRLGEIGARHPGRVVPAAWR